MINLTINCADWQIGIFKKKEDSLQNRFKIFIFYR
jgi:hypothetical protein